MFLKESRLKLQSTFFIYLFTSGRNDTRNFIPEYSHELVKVEILFSKLDSTSDTNLTINMTAKILSKYKIFLFYCFLAFKLSLRTNSQKLLGARHVA